MPVQSERIAKLQSFGLTENQAKAYVALLEIGRATASALNKVSGVPRNKVYSIVEELNEKGLVDIVLEDPIVFAPRPITRYLEVLVAQLDAEKMELVSQRDSLEGEFRVKRVVAQEDLNVGSFRIYKGRRAILQQHARMNRETKEIMRVLATPASAARSLASGTINDYPGGEQGPDVRFEAYMPLTPDNVEAVEALRERVPDIRITHGMPENLVIKVADDREVMFTHFVPDSESINSGDDIGVWTDNPVFLRLARNLIKQAAARSNEFELAKQLLGEGRDLPRFEVVHDPREVRQTMTEAYGRASEMAMIACDADLSLVSEIMNAGGRRRLESGDERIRILTDADPATVARHEFPATVEVRTMKAIPGRVAIFDDHVLRVYSPDGMSMSDIDQPGTVTIVSNLDTAGREARDHFERLWADATAVRAPGEPTPASDATAAEARTPSDVGTAPRAEG